MNRSLLIICALFGLGMSFVSFPNGALSVLLILIIVVPAAYFINRYASNNTFLLNIFLVGLLLRILLGLIIFNFDLRGVFGPDSYTYDSVGGRLLDIWMGIPAPNDLLTYRINNPTESGRGMYYVVATIYLIFGKSLFVAQTFCGIIGALTVPMVYFCADKIFGNQRVARLSAIFIALFPSFIIWSSQLLKDGLIVFLLVSVMVLVIKLQEKLNYFQVALLVFSLFGILTLRFYIFYMVVLSVAGSFAIGLSSSVKSIVRNLSAVILIGLALTYFGVIRNTQTDLSTYANLERIQNSREDLARSANSGFGEDLDVSTPEGAIAALPIGFLYLFLAPFPWQVNNLQQVLVLPETFLWWCLIPVMISGLLYTIRHKLRAAIPVLTFSLMLTLSYTIFQGNVGMIYRQRTQIQVFLFMFIAVGITLIKERRENDKLKFQAERERFRKNLEARRNED